MPKFVLELHIEVKDESEAVVAAAGAASGILTAGGIVAQTLVRDEGGDLVYEKTYPADPRHAHMVAFKEVASRMG